MGRGIAKQAADRYCGLQRAYQDALRVWPEAKRSEPAALARFPQVLLFPVKYDWRDKADLALIERNLGLLHEYGKRFAIPELGCGYGECTWAEVKPLVWAADSDTLDLLVVHPDVAALRAEARYAASFRAGARSDRRFS